MKTKILSPVLLGIILTITYPNAQSQNWKTDSRQTRQYGMLYAAYTFSKSDSNVSLGIACMEGQRNASVYVKTSSSIVGQPNTTEISTIAVSKGGAKKQTDNISIHYATVTEDGMGLYLGTGIVGAGITDLIKHNDWMTVAWNYTAPSRPNWMKNLLGNPESKPGQEHTFELTGFAQATSVMSKACRW